MDEMDTKDWKRINDTLRSRGIDSSQNKHIGCIRIHPTETKEHFLGKCEEAWDIHKLGHAFIVEAWTFDHKQRFDILDLITGEDREVETGMSKKKKYKGDKVIEV